MHENENEFRLYIGNDGILSQIGPPTVAGFNAVLKISCGVIYETSKTAFFGYFPVENDFVSDINFID